MDDKSSNTKRTFTEEIEVMGNQLVQKVKDLLKQGNVRQLRLKASDGDILFETPLTFGVVAGGAVALAAPWLAILGAVAAFVTHARIEVVREIDDADGEPVAEAAPVEDPVRAAPEVVPEPKPAPKARPATKAKAKTTRAKPATKAKPGPKAAS
ncbi:DUF4342 domain-containing protein [Hoeflea olei]|uniref:DUF4342 domain-containing protein n=1 Tax=Hoeflea olei TaxID=1480615 RepID=UPI0008252136|nr:DUF4342 domain-containing protein [Hoeflea olei]